MTTTRLALVGFGNVGKAFARLLLRKKSLLSEQKNIQFLVTGILTGSHGGAIDPSGLDLESVLQLLADGKDINSLSKESVPHNGVDFIRRCPADVMVETTPVNHTTGQPAISHLEAALNAGMHAVTANKGPVVHGFKLLTKTAADNTKRFLFESSVMDGAPIFSLFRETLPLA